ncbi:membrane protein insertion efficiency factor YidD [Xanthobacter sp. AM11]|uniref:membrane protein insertion efficiency factor YidD n=1 Tax=Xanthobacter sp. AM11 TaxID=3380643 RepID=UPI0039BF190A
MMRAEQVHGEPPEQPAQAGGGRAAGLLALLKRLPRHALRALILVYRYTLSSIMGRQCRYLPTCSEYAEEAVMHHGALPGAVMATARICRCHPWGGHGYDPVPRCLPADARWYRPWRYGVWKMPPQAEAPDTAPDDVAKA